MKRIAMMSLIIVAGCGGSSGKGNGGGGGGAGGGGSTGGGGATYSGIAVIDSDYKSTVLALVDSSGTKLSHDDCIDSGTVSTSLSTALSGDMVLSGAQPDGDVLLIDRMNSALDWVKPGACTVDAQLSIGAFAANPHAAVGLSATKTYVTRNAPNTAGGSAANNDQGNDILIVNPTAQTITGHIDVSRYAGTSATTTILARPDSAILADGKVWVTLANESLDYKTTVDGGLIAIDPATDAVTASLTLTGYKDCGGLGYDDATKTLLVSCQGDFYAPTPAEQLAESALVLVDVSGATPAVKKAIVSTSLGSWPINSATFAGTNLVLATTFGDFSGTTTQPDSLWTVAVDTGTATKLADADAAGSFGNAVYQADKKQVLTTDASMTKPVIRVYDVSNPAAVTEMTTFDPNPKSGLPPRELGLY